MSQDLTKATPSPEGDGVWQRRALEAEHLLQMSRDEIRNAKLFLLHAMGMTEELPGSPGFVDVVQTAASRLTNTQKPLLVGMEDVTS